ncbi:unnamed protein product, partial [Polarella glacialis]
AQTLCWSEAALRAWPVLVGRAASAALAPWDGEELPTNGEEQAGHLPRAAPHVPLACLALLPPIAGRLHSCTTLADLHELRRFAIHMGSEKADNSQSLTTSELQVSVELSLRRIALVAGQKESFRSEERALPYWLDIVLDPTPKYNEKPD